MKKAVNIAVIAVTGFSIAACDQAAGLFSDSSKGAIAACEAYVLSTLKAPATYKRVQADYIVDKTFNFSDYQRYERTKFCGYGESWAPCTETNRFLIAVSMKAVGDKLGYKKPTKKQIKTVEDRYWKESFAVYQSRRGLGNMPATVVLNYDAENTFGTPLRASEVCKFGPKQQNATYTRGDLYLGVEVDGVE